MDVLRSRQRYTRLRNIRARHALATALSCSPKVSLHTHRVSQLKLTKHLHLSYSIVSSVARFAVMRGFGD